MTAGVVSFVVDDSLTAGVVESVPETGASVGGTDVSANSNCSLVIFKSSEGFSCSAVAGIVLSATINSFFCELYYRFYMKSF